MKDGKLLISPTVLALLLGLFLPASVSAVNIQGDLRTYLQVWENAEGDSVIPLHEYFDFSADNFSSKELSFHLGAWIRQDLSSNSSFDRKSFNSDLQYAYLDLRQKRANAYLNLGRVLVYEGTASELVDGISAGTDLKGGFGITAYGGLPVESDFDGRKGDVIYGGRASHQIPNRYSIGISYLKERNDNSDFRTETGLDLRVRPHEKVDLYGQSTYNAETSGWMEHAYYLTLLPFQSLRVGTEISSTRYEDYFASVDSVTTGVFDLDLGILDPEERLLLLGGNAEYSLREDLALTAKYKQFNYKIAENADYYGGGLIYSPLDDSGAGLSFYRMDGQTVKRRYYESRVYGYRTLGKINLTVDLFNVTYDEKINRVKNAYSASLALGYHLTENTRTAVDLDFSRGPDFDKEIRVFLILNHRFDLSSQMMTEGESIE